MGNTHSETPIPQREQEVPPQAAEETERAGPGTNFGKNEEPKAMPPLASGLERDPGPQAGEGDANPQVGLGDLQVPGTGLSANTKAKLCQSKKRKIAKARKWASGQEPATMAEGRLESKKPQPMGMADQGRAPPRSLQPEVAMHTNYLSGGSEIGVQEPSDSSGLKACRGLERRGRGEPTGVPSQILPPAGQGQTGKRAPVSGASRVEAEAPKPQSSQASAAGKESPGKMIMVGIIPTSPGPVPGQGSQTSRRHNEDGPPTGQDRKPDPTPAGPEAQPSVRTETLNCAKQAQGPGHETTPRMGCLKPHSFLSKRGAHVDPVLGPTPPWVNQPPFPASLSYSQALKWGLPVARCPAGEAEVPREAREVPQAQDVASKKKLPFYEQLIASLKSQAQRQRSAKLQKPILGQEGPSQCQPATIKAEAVQEPLSTPKPQAEQKPTPPPSLLSSLPSVQFEAQLRPQVLAKAEGKPVPSIQPVFQIQSPRTSCSLSSVSQGPPPGSARLHLPLPLPIATTGFGPKLHLSSSCEAPAQAQHRLECGALASTPYPQPGPDSVAPGPLPIQPVVQSQSQGQTEPGMAAQQLPKATSPTPPHPPTTCGVQQLQQGQLGPSPTPAEAQPQPETNVDPNPPAPTPIQAHSKLAAARPRKQQQPAQKAAAKAKPPAQASGKKAPPAQWQEPPQVQAEAEPDTPQRPAGRWTPFQVDTTCTRKCYCRHREEQGSINGWTDSVREPFCETLWVRTAVLAGSLVAGTKFCMDHFKADNNLN
ncbi:uncharacterized protein [Hemitrygon akajei]|uniref:uncharacterized protein n=1 Tax=Hemitrygon akajei TaxID=2704970 RepID=UPI003BF963FD